MWSEELLGLGSGKEDESGTGTQYTPEHSDLNSIAGGDYLQYQAAIRKQNGGEIYILRGRERKKKVSLMCFAIFHASVYSMIHFKTTNLYT